MRHRIPTVILFAALVAGEVTLMNTLQAADPPASASVNIGSDPQLFLDDFAVARMEGLRRAVHVPARLPEPIIGGKERPLNFIRGGCFSGAIFDDEKNLFRMWFDVGNHVWTSESKDGLCWEKPTPLWPFSREKKWGYGASVIDDRANEKDPVRRFKMAHWLRPLDEKDVLQTGTCVAWSPDGVQWTPYEGNPVMPMFPDGPGKSGPLAVGDHTDLFFDPIRRHYGICVRMSNQPEDRFQVGRLTGLIVSKDFLHWEKPRRIFVPDEKDDRSLEFYGMGGVHIRGSLLIGFVRILRDDLKADDPPDPPKAFGIGYTVLASSRDGFTWQRLREPFLDRSSAKGAFDHAHAWAFGAVPVSKEAFIYYAGYDCGHKCGKRQIGLARMRRDGYVSLDAGPEGGWLQTPPLLFQGNRLTLNTETAEGGSIRAEIQDADGKPLPRFSSDDCPPLAGSDTDRTVHWNGGSDVSSLAGKPVRLKIAMRSAKLFAFQFMKAP